MPQLQIGTSTGTCSVCGLVYHLVPSTGCLHRHGYSASYPACSGTGKLPIGAASDGATGAAPDALDEAMCCSPASPSDSDSASDDSSPSFTMTPPTFKIIKRIPRPARHRAGMIFESCLKDVVRLGTLASWRRLFNFASALRQPSRGGRRINLSARILAQLDMFDSGDDSPTAHTSLSSTNQRGRKTARPVNMDKSAASRASIKLDLGDVKGAMRILSSDNTYVSPDNNSYSALLAKHPAAPIDRRLPPAISSDAFSGSVPQCMSALKSFSPGSASGLDGLSPQHIQDMVQASSPEALPKALCDFMNLVLAGGVPPLVRPSFFGASLHALRKKDGGLRPIAIGLALRRLASKMANKWASSCLLSKLAPRQLGVGVRGGAEAIVHAARAFVASSSPYHALVKLDFQNAFNAIRRDCLLESVAVYVPQILPYVLASYGSPSTLVHGPFSLSSAEGVQQGDPQGPLLFSLAISDA